MLTDRIQIGTVTILKDRKYYEKTLVPSGAYPVYFDLEKELIYWEMQGYPSKWEGEAKNY